MGTHPIFESDFDCLTEPKQRMSFGDVSTAAGLQKLDSFLLDKAYVAGWTPSQEDVKVFQSIKSSPDAKFINALRWWKNLASYKSEFGSFGAGAAQAEEENEEAERIKAERIAAYNARKSAKEENKGKVIAK